MIDLRHGDCLEVMKSIPDGSIDAIITDPPYGTTACKWDSVIPFEPMWEELKRIIKSNGAIVLFGSEPFSSKLRISNFKMFKYNLIWKKNTVTGFMQAKTKPLKSYEDIIIFGNFKIAAQYLKERIILKEFIALEQLIIPIKEKKTTSQEIEIQMFLNQIKAIQKIL